MLDFIDTRRAGGAPAAGVAAPAVPTTATPAPAAQAAPTRPGAPVSAPSTSPATAGTDEIIPFTNIRRRTAEHMVRSKATSPHTLVVLEADYEQVERVRRSHGAQFKAEEGFALTYLPFVARATVEALHEWPHLNASVGDDSLIVHHQFNVGFAVDLDHKGLIVPVVRHAEELTLRGMARRIRELADRALTKKLSADDISGGTFSITNAGPFGTFLTAPIINQPQVAILSTDGVKRRPTVVVQPDGTEAIAIHSLGLLCLAWDHRAVDGAYAAAFVARVTEIARPPTTGPPSSESTSTPSPQTPGPRQRRRQHAPGSLARSGPLRRGARAAARPARPGTRRPSAAPRAPPRVHAGRARRSGPRPGRPGGSWEPTS